MSVNKAKQVICSQPCTIQVPKGFFESGLGQLGDNISVYGLFPVILSTGEFALVNTSAMFSISPTSISIIKVEEVEYYEFYFAKDTVVFKTTSLLESSKIIFEAFQAFFFMGRVPWYVGYDDHAKLFDTAVQFAGFGPMRNPEMVEFLTAMVARQANSTNSNFLRNIITDYSETEIGKVTFIPMGSVIASVKSSLNKISGAYAQDGIISAIVSPSTQVGTVERIVRA